MNKKKARLIIDTSNLIISYIAIFLSVFIAMLFLTVEQFKIIGISFLILILLFLTLVIIATSEYQKLIKIKTVKETILKVLSIVLIVVSVSTLILLNAYKNFNVLFIVVSSFLIITNIIKLVLLK